MEQKCRSFRIRIHIVALPIFTWHCSLANVPCCSLLLLSLHLFCLHNRVRSGSHGALSFSLSVLTLSGSPFLTMMLLKVNGLLHDRLLTYCTSPILWYGKVSHLVRVQADMQHICKQSHEHSRTHLHVHIVNEQSGHMCTLQTILLYLPSKTFYPLN